MARGEPDRCDSRGQRSHGGQVDQAAKEHLGAGAARGVLEAAGDQQASGDEPISAEGSNWPKLPQKKTDAAWREDVVLLHELHRKLRKAVEEIDEKRLDYVTRRLIHGAAGHDIYHAGQIKLMRRLIE